MRALTIAGLLCAGLLTACAFGVVYPHQFNSLRVGYSTATAAESINAGPRTTDSLNINGRPYVRQLYLMEYSANETWRFNPLGSTAAGAKPGVGAWGSGPTRYDIQPFYMLFRNDSLLHWGTLPELDSIQDKDIRQIVKQTKSDH